MKHKLLRMITKKTEKYTKVKRHKEMLISLLFVRKNMQQKVIMQRKHFTFSEFQQVGSYLTDLASSGRSLNTQSR